MNKTLQNLPQVMVVEDHQPLWEVIQRACSSEPWQFQFVTSGEEAVAKATPRSATLDLAVIDVRLPGMDGVEVLRSLHSIDASLPVVMLTAQGDCDTAVRCLRLGACDYIAKPFRNEDLCQRFRKALEASSLSRRCARLELKGHLAALMGPSEAVWSLAQLTSQVSPTEMAVLIEGESGTGKELLARRIHSLSRRAKGPFVAVDCGAIPETLLEGELFGFRKGSFTGASADQEGKFQAADGGTLFLDEIGNLPLHMQAKLLRALQQKEVTPLGASRAIPFSARILSATNNSLLSKVKRNEFRLDLFHRLAEFPIQIPPLRERPEDLLYLAIQFLKEACLEFGKEISGFNDAAVAQILSYAWPGNVRELKSLVRRGALLNEGRIGHLDLERLMPPSTFASTIQMDSRAVISAQAIIAKDAASVPLKQIRKRLIRQIDQGILSFVLAQVGGNKSQAARVLELDYKTIYTLSKTIGGEKEDKHEQKTRS